MREEVSELIFVTAFTCGESLTSPGIGRAIAEKFLLRPNHTVIGSVRDATSSKNEDLKKLPTADGSRLLLVSIESTSHTDPRKAVQEIEAAGVAHVDIAIANAGVCPPAAGPDTADVQDVIDAFNVNTVSPFLLYQALKPLLDKSSKPVWITVSTIAASIGGLEANGAAIVSAYGISKAAVNFLTM